MRVRGQWRMALAQDLSRSCCELLRRRLWVSSAVSRSRSQRSRCVTTGSKSARSCSLRRPRAATQHCSRSCASSVACKHELRATSYKRAVVVVAVVVRVCARERGRFSLCSSGVILNAGQKAGIARQASIRNSRLERTFRQLITPVSSFNVHVRMTYFDSVLSPTLRDPHDFFG